MNKQNMIIGYTAGVYDLFHIGHLNLLKNAKGLCDKLIVGVTVDELVLYKGKRAMIPFEDRIEIVRNIKFVDAAVPQYDMDKLSMCKKLGASILFVGDDWYGTEKWMEYEKEFHKAGIRIIYFPYTKGISSTKINTALQHIRENSDKKIKHMVDKDFCMSSYLAFRYIEDNEKQFAENLHHQKVYPVPLSAKTLVGNTEDTDIAIKNVFKLVTNEKLGILLSGGMDSGCLASYMPAGSVAYTFKFLGGGENQDDELERAKYYAKKWKLDLHYVDIDWSVVESSVDACMTTKGAPVHSIEPQIYHAAQQAKKDGITMMVIGDGADYVFGGMDGLLGKNWEYQEYIDRSVYVKPEDVLVSPVSMDYLFERYRIGRNSIDYIGFYEGPVTDESYASYENAFKAAGMAYIDPYDKLKLNHPLDLDVNRKESKKVVRELFKMKYPECSVPLKIPMPRPVDIYFKDWTGPKRTEFRKDIDLTKYSGNQKWLLWCLERFLDKFVG